MAGAERRKHRRVRAKGLAAHVRALDRSFTCSVENLSEGGIFLATEEPLPRGSIVAIDLVKPSAPKALRVIGVVVAEAAPASGAASAPAAKGMGIQFAQPSPEARAKLIILLSELTGEPRAVTLPATAPHGGAPAAPPPVRAIVTPFAAEAMIAPSSYPQVTAEPDGLRAQVQALRSELVAAKRERDALAAELQRLRAQIPSQRATSDKRSG